MKLVPRSSCDFVQGHIEVIGDEAINVRRLKVKQEHRKDIAKLKSRLRA